MLYFSRLFKLKQQICEISIRKDLFKLIKELSPLEMR